MTCFSMVHTTMSSEKHSTSSISMRPINNVLKKLKKRRSWLNWNIPKCYLKKLGKNFISLMVQREDPTTTTFQPKWYVLAMPKPCLCCLVLRVLFKTTMVKARLQVLVRAQQQLQMRTVESLALTTRIAEEGETENSLTLSSDIGCWSIARTEKRGSFISISILTPGSSKSGPLSSCCSSSMWPSWCLTS